MKKRNYFSLINCCLAMLCLTFAMSCKNPAASAVEPEKVSISYVTSQSKAPEKKTVNKGYKLTDSDLPTLKAESFKFEGWFLDSKKAEKDFIVSKDISLTAKWTKGVIDKKANIKKAENCTISYDLNNKEDLKILKDSLSSKEVIKGYKLTEKDLPVLKDTPTHNFNGWVIHNAEAKKNYEVTKDIKLTAVWTEKGSADEVTFSPIDNEVDKGTKVSLSSKTKDAQIYYAFDDNEDFVKYTNPLIIENAVKIKAIAKKEGLKDSKLSIANYTIKTYKVSFDNCGKGELSQESITGLLKNQSIQSEQLPSLQCPGYVFKGWEKDGQIFDAEKISKDITLTAKWEPKNFKITYHIGDGSHSNPDSYTIESEDIVLQSPIKKNAKFEGWFTDQNLKNKLKNTTIEKGSYGDIELWAKWKLDGLIFKIPAGFEKGVVGEYGIKITNHKNNAEENDNLGRKYSILLGDTPDNDGYSDSNLNGSYRIPAITKMQLPSGQTRLIAAYDARYRGNFTGNGDVGQGSAGSDCVIIYSDDFGQTWTNAGDRLPLSAPKKSVAINVKNLYNEHGKEDTGAWNKEVTPDICDPQLIVIPNGNGLIYCGFAAGGGNNKNNANFRIFKSSNYGETWTEAEGSSANQSQNHFFNKWGKDMTNGGYFQTVLTTPGHSIITTKDVPGSNIKKGQVVSPIFLNGNPSASSKKYGIYLATGTDSNLKNWNTSDFTPYQMWNGNNTEEGQICQLDDGSLLLYSKSGNDQFSQFKNNKWTSLTNTISGGLNCKTGICKVIDGDGKNKHGIVAFSYSGNGASNASNEHQGKGRGNLTICFARDISTSVSDGSMPLDEKEPYYIKLRTQGQSYFGYTDMVMIDDNTLGVIYENYSTDKEVHGIRFVRIDISEIIQKLSTKNL